MSETIKTYTPITVEEAGEMLRDNGWKPVKGLAFKNVNTSNWGTIGKDELTGIDLDERDVQFFVEGNAYVHCAKVTELDPCVAPDGCPELGSMNWVEFDLDGRKIYVSDGGYICYKHKRFHTHLVIAGATQGAGYKVWESASKQYQVHRIVAEAFLSDYSKELQVDHINGDRGDNSIGNLRMVTPSENNRGFNEKRKDSTSKYRGVCLVESGRWAANIGYDGKCFALGRFDTEEEAAKAYDKAAFDNGFSMEALNFPDEHCRIRNYQEPDAFEEWVYERFCKTFIDPTATYMSTGQMLKDIYELGQQNPTT